MTDTSQCVPINILMKLFTEIFNCRYPIAVMAMNKVSDLALACAVRRAGALPSLSIFNYLIAVIEDQLKVQSILNYEDLNNDLYGYQQEFGDCNILLSLNLLSLADDKIFEMLLKYKVKAVEVIKDDKDFDNEALEKLPNAIQSLRSNGSLLFRKAIVPLHIGRQGNPRFAASAVGVPPPPPPPPALGGTDLWSKLRLHGFIIKGPDGAGRGSTDGTTLEEACSIIKSRFPDKPFIASGGIGTSEQVLWHMSNGAFAVGVGTMLAACRESKISEATKLKMIAASSADLSKLSTGSHTETAQNALVFSSDIKEKNMNNTRGLIEGIKDPSRGHVFAGKAIDQITEILPAADIIQRLAKDL